MNRSPGEIGDRAKSLATEFAASVAPALWLAMHSGRAARLGALAERQRLSRDLHHNSARCSSGSVRLPNHRLLAALTDPRQHVALPPARDLHDADVLLGQACADSDDCPASLSTSVQATPSRQATDTHVLPGDLSSTCSPTSSEARTRRRDPAALAA